MKSFKWVIVLFALLMINVSNLQAMGYLPPEDTFETSAQEASADDGIVTEVDFNRCLPHETSPQEPCYVSGGVSGDEVRQFKARAKEYLMEIVFVQKTDSQETDRIEEYLAEVYLQIKDTKGNTVVDMTTDGPFFLADLPLGKYQIIAEHEGVVKSNVIRVLANKHQRVVFLWDR